jgi:hypothetical protein
MTSILETPENAGEAAMFRPSLVAGCLIALTLTQRDAVRASCRSDFMANCASVQPGGKEALECLLRNDSKLSAPCRSAVNAIATPVANPAETAPAAAAAPSDTSPPAQGQSSTPVAAVDKQDITPYCCSDTENPGHNARSVDTGHPDRLRRDRRIRVSITSAGSSTARPDTPDAANAQQLSPLCYDALARVSE